ncbi:Bifunctional inhibitor/lipid-transfer protein/seed storage 2S albumin superfamily protein [Striga hermonthica]|uniref:Bifunctional inhibitor/lipid-transfer protein/seed storage 2S albumin superfamily protein n=1 Tax=Striga hermonthica TaxID=68872 RepID=A0A9N7N1D9_STRHE|nr:Bifunctional inhibitor/lipid-transfer protein/seed storage 2S albumin superfamily protein [Striga hermonthica]
MNSKSSSLLPLFTILIIFYPVLIHSDDAKDKQECAQPLAGLATCLPYVGGSARTPTPDCCTGLKQILKTNKKCLCVVVKDGNDPDLSLGINVTLALGLPQVCNQPANVSQCPALLNLPPNSPDAQIFYQFGPKSSNAPASSPLAGGPTPNGADGPSAGVRGIGGRTNIRRPQPSNNHGTCIQVKRKWLGLEIMLGLILSYGLVMYY